MEEPILQPGTNFLNPYEKMYSILKDTNPQFQEDIWNKVINGSASGVDVNLYIDAIQKIKDMDVKTLEDDYNLAYSDWNARLMAQLNEAHKEENLQNIIKRERYVYNDDGSVKMENYEPVKEPYNIDNYTYTKDLIRQQGEIGYQKYLFQQEKERKDSMNDFTKFLAGTAATPGHIVSGFIKEVDGIANFFEGLIAGINTAIKGGSFRKGMADYIVSQDTSKEWGTQLEDLLLDFESRYTHLRDLEGNLTGAGKFFVSTADSFGQMVPSMIVTAATAGVGGAISGVTGAVISKGIPIISQTIFYSGITANQAREMYQYYAANGVTVPTETILANAEMKSVAQAGVEIMLGKLMGGSALDNLTYGRAMGKSFVGKTFAGKGLVRLAHDFIEEGSEEVLQEFSDYFVDKIWQSTNSNWGQFADITPENLGLSFVIGGISSFIGSAVKIINTPDMKVATSVDADGNITYKKLGKGIGGKIAAYEYGVTLQEAISNVNKIIEHRQRVYDAVSKTNILAEKFGSLKGDVVNKELGRETLDLSDRALQKADVALTQAYAAYRMLASVYQEVGPERFNAANDILIYGTKNNDTAYYNLTADILMNKLQKLGSVIPQKYVTKKGKEKLANVYVGEFRDLIIDRKLGNIMKTVKADSDDLTEAEKELFKNYPTIKDVIIVDKGDGAVETEDAVIVSSSEINNAGADVVISDLMEQKLAADVASLVFTGKHLLGEEFLKDIYKEVFGKEATRTDLVYKLCFNDEFYRAILFKSNRDALELLTTLYNKFKSVKINNYADGILKTKYEHAVEMMKTELKKSMIFNYRAQIPDIFTDKEKREILRERWGVDMMQRVSSDVKNITEDDKRKLFISIDAMFSVSKEEKDKLKQDVVSPNDTARRMALNKIRKEFDTYKNRYDGEYYMPENVIPNIVFNKFLESKGLTIKTLLNENNLTKSDLAYVKENKLTVLAYRQRQFEEFCNNQYSFGYSERMQEPNDTGMIDYSKPQVTLYAMTERQVVGFNNYLMRYDEPDQKFTNLTRLSKDIQKVLYDFMPDTLSDEQKSNLTVKDLIFDYNLLSDSVNNEILAMFGLSENADYREITPDMRYVYFRIKIPTIIPNVSINNTVDGDVVFVNFRPYNEILKKDIKLSTFKTGTSITKFIKLENLVGSLQDIKIIVSRSLDVPANYDENTNTIHIRYEYTKNEEKFDFLKVAICHEFQHAVQVQNGLNGGFTSNFSTLVKDKTLLRKMIDDVKKHVPELFTGSKGQTLSKEQEIQAFDTFIYHCTGETLAYGHEFSNLTTFYPIMIDKLSGGKFMLIMPWGTKFIISKAVDLMRELRLKPNDTIFDILKKDSQDIEQGDFVKSLKSATIFDGKIYATDNFKDVENRLNTYFANVPNEQLENRIIKIDVKDSSVRLIASGDLSTSQNKDLNTMYAVALAAKKQGLEVQYQDSARPEIFGTLDIKKDTDKSVTEAVENVYIDYSLNQLDNTYDDSTVDLDIKPEIVIPKAPEKRKYEKTEKNKGRYISDTKRETYESLKKVRSKQLSPELQEFYIGAEKNKNIASELRDAALKGKLRWSSDESGKMSVSYYFRTADKINEETFNLINDSFFKNKYIKTFDELEKLISQVSNIYAVYQMFTDDKLTDIIENWTPEAVERYVNLLNTRLGTKEGQANLERFNKLSSKYGETLSKTYWREGGNKGYFRLNFMKYYDGTISSIYQFAKELIGINNSKWNTDIIQGQQSSAQNNRGDTNEIDILENQAFKVDADLSGLSERLRDVLSDFMERSIPIKEYVDRMRVIHDHMVKYKLIEYLRKTGYPKTAEELLNATKSLGILVYDEIAMSLEDSYNLDDTVNEFEDKWVLFPDWVAYPKNFKYQAFDKELLKGKDKEKQMILVEKYVSTKFEYWLNNVYDAILTKYNLLAKTISKQQDDLTEKLLSGKELREPANVVRSIKYYFRTIGPNLSAKEAELIAEQNPDLFVYNKDTGEFSLNEDSYLMKVPGIHAEKTAYKLIDDLTAVQTRIRNIANGIKIGAYRNKKSMDAYNKSLKKLEKKVERLTEEANKISKGRTQKIVTYNINENEVKIEGDDNMPTIIYDILKNQNARFEARQSHVKFLSDEDDAHVKANLTNFVKENIEYLQTITQNDVNEIISFYLTHSILSDGWSVDFETVRACLLAYILRESNLYDSNARFVLDENVANKIEDLLRIQATKGGQYLRIQKKVIRMLDPTKDILMEMASRYGFQIEDTTIESLAQAIDHGDINRVGELKSEIMLDLISQNRVKKNYNTFIKSLSKFVESDMTDYDKFLSELNKKIDDESKYGKKSYIRSRLTDLRDAIVEKQKLTDTSELTDKMINYLSNRVRLVSEKSFDKDEDLSKLFGSYANYKNAYYTYQIKEQSVALNDYFKIKFKNTESFLDKLWNFERAMMLTSPGTWVRNQVSDAILHTTNRISDSLITIGDKMFSKSKKWHKQGQYKIAGTKVISIDIKEFVDRLTDKKQTNNIFSQIDDAINKYDARKITKNTPDMNLAELIINKLAIDVSRGDIPFDKLGTKDDSSKMEKAIAKSKKFLFKMLSDSMWIKTEFKRVLARMLTEENIDVTAEGLSNKVQSIIAEAYTFAAQTYMHKSNFMNKFDDVIRKNAGSLGYFMWKQVFPFASASWNWFMEGLSYTPVGLAKGIVNLVKLDNTIQKLDSARQKGEPVISSKFAEYLAKRQIGHGVIGTFGFIVGALLAGFGKAGLDEEDGKYKLFVGDVMIDISDVFSTNGLLVGMSLVQACQQNSGDNWFENFMYIINTVMNQMVLESSFSDLFNTIRYNKNLGDFMTTMGIYTIPSMFIPNFLKSLSGLFGKYKVKYVSGVVGKLERLGFQIAPYLTLLDSVPKYIDPYTGEKQVALKLGWFEEDWLIPSILNKYGPIDFKPYNVSKYEKEAIELGIKKSMLTGNYKINDTNVTVSGKTLEALNKYYGELNQSMLEPLFDDRIRIKVQIPNGSYKELRYSQMSDAQKKNAIENIMEKNAKYSEIYTMTTKYDYKYFATEDEFKALRKLGITENIYRANNKYKGFIKK